MGIFTKTMEAISFLLRKETLEKDESEVSGNVGQEVKSNPTLETDIDPTIEIQDSTIPNEATIVGFLERIKRLEDQLADLRTDKPIESLAQNKAFYSRTVGQSGIRTRIEERMNMDRQQKNLEEITHTSADSAESIFIFLGNTFINLAMRSREILMKDQK